MRLAVLNIAHPFAPVGFGTAGGAEQIVAALDRALCAAGHRSLVVGCAGSQVDGTLIPVPRIPNRLDDAAIRLGHERLRHAIAATLAEQRIDVVHMHGVDIHACLPPPGAPVLVTLHLALDHYDPRVLRPARLDVWFNCVSAWQHRAAPPRPDFLPPIENGVAIDDGIHGGPRRRFALMLSRICPEKGVHLAIDAAKRAGIPLLIAGTVFPYDSHSRYFDEQVRPRLDRHRRFIGPVGPRRKARLLAKARCVLIPSLVAETSSLVAREAAAAGTPVIAFPSGAMAETVEHDRTGFLVQTVEEMAAAIDAAPQIAPELCRRVARDRFSRERMTAAYMDAYQRLARSPASAERRGAA